MKQTYIAPEADVRFLTDADILTVSALDFEKNGYGDEIDFGDFVGKL